MFMRLFSLFCFVFFISSCTSFIPQPPIDYVNEPIASLGMGYFQDLAWSPNGDFLAIASTRGIWLYPNADTTREPQLLAVEGGIRKVKFSPSGNYLASVGEDGRIWDMQNQELLFVIYERKPEEQNNGGRTVQDLIFSPNETYIGVEGYNIISIWDLATAEMLSEHAGGSLRFAPNSTTFLYSLYSEGDVTLYAWDLLKDEEVYSFLLLYATEALEISADGQSIVIIFENTNTGESGMQFISLETGEEISRLQPFAFASSLIFSPINSQLMAFVDNVHQSTPGFRTSIVFWDVETNTIIRRLSGYTAPITSLAFSPDGHYLASSEGGDYETWESHIRLWNVEDGSLVAISQAFVRDDIQKVVFSPDGQRLASIHSEGKIYLWTIPDLQAIQMIGQGTIAGQLAVDGSAVVMASTDGALRLWQIDSDAYTYSLSAALQSESIPLNDMTASDSLSYVAFSTGNIYDRAIDGRVYTLEVWTPQTGELKLLYEHETQGIWTMAINHQGTILAAITSEGLVFWDLATGERLPLILDQSTVSIASLKFSPDDQLLASGGCGGLGAEFNCTIGEIHLWNVQTGEHLFGPLNDHTSTVYALDFSADSSELITGSGGDIYYGTPDDYSIVRWDLNTGQRIGWPALGHQGQITTILIDNQGEYFLSGSGGAVFSGEANIRLWNNTLQTLVIYDDNAQNIVDLAFRADKPSFVSLHSDGILRFWNLPEE